MTKDEHIEFQEKIVKGLEKAYDRLIEFKKEKTASLSSCEEVKLCGSSRNRRIKANTATPSAKSSPDPGSPLRLFKC